MQRGRSPVPWLLFTVPALLLPGVTPGRGAEPAQVQLDVDGSEITRRIVHAKLVIPAQPGPLTLYYPKWIPGTHSPVGPVSDQAGLRIRAGEATLAWQRDEVDPYALHCTVPAGASAVEVALDLLLQPPGVPGLLGSSLTSASSRLAILNWNEVLLYPKGGDMLRQPFRATLRLPAGWKLGTALPIDGQPSEGTTFRTVTLETLIDSPVLCGELLKVVPVGPAGGQHRVVLACDSEAGLEVAPETKAGWDRLVEEAGRLFGTRHYESYTFLLALSEHVPSFGLEHHQSSDNRLPELALVKPPLRRFGATLFPHEYTHSWNGKFRRPADMIMADYQQAERTRLLWVYEGLTNYLGWVLATRSGLWSADDARDALAVAAERMSNQRGRTWRPLEDTAVASYLLYASRPAWGSWRRSTDFYDEGTLIWLEVDARIRKETHGARSLDDFCRRFHGGEGGKPQVVGYTFDGVVAALNEVAPYDWKGLLTRRVAQPSEKAPLDGLKLSGWRLTYQDKPSAMTEAIDGFFKGVDLTSSLGLQLSPEGAVIDVIPDKPAAKAGLAPGMKLAAVNGRRYSADILKAAVAATKSGGKLELLAENGDFFRAYALDYRDGAMYPRLERAADQTDLLAEILKPRTATGGERSSGGGR
jgi:predicted metalloprotease with PDZ domain